jgi:protein-S-isoprenylcysteine O-methyltransferase Ste14
MTATILESDDPTAGQLRAAVAAPPQALPELALSKGALPDLVDLYARQPPRKCWVERKRGKLGVGFLLPLVALAAFSPPLAPQGSWASLAIRSLACMLFLAGGACRFWAMLYIGGRKGLVVVSGGPYSLMRNPLYGGTFLMTLSLVVFLENLTSIVGYGLIAAFYLCSTIPSEERRLAFKLGATYRDYCRQVPRWWPKLSGFRSGRRIPVDIHCLALEARRALVWMWIPIAAGLLAQLRLQSWWPQITWLP